MGDTLRGHARGYALRRCVEGARKRARIEATHEGGHSEGARKGAHVEATRKGGHSEGALQEGGGGRPCVVCQERQGMGERQHRVASRRRPEARRERHFVRVGESKFVEHK